VIVRPILQVTSTPDASMLLGGRGNAEIVNKINSRWSNTGVIFGSNADPFADRFAEFNRAFVNTARDTAHLLDNTSSFILNNEPIRTITSADALAYVPAAMYLPILTYAPIRELFEQDKLYGWGINKADLPETDEFGRLINNGYIGPDPLTGELPEYYEWVARSTDPEFTMEELEDMAASREFIDSFIMGQLESGQLQDPTDYLDGGLIGNLR
jgi:hypothetical protein